MTLLGDIIPVVWSDNWKIVCGYGSRNTAKFFVLIEVSTTCFGHCWVGHRQVEDKLSQKTVQYKIDAIYIKRGEGNEISFYNSSPNYY
jgi:hypothetical protein